MKKACIITFGCQMNKLDSELVGEVLLDNGYKLVEKEDKADVIIFNTCSVRDHAEQRVLSRLAALKARKIKKPDLVLGIMGCFAERKGEKHFEDMPYLDFVVGTKRFMHIPEIIEKIQKEKQIMLGYDFDYHSNTQGIVEAHARKRHKGIHAFVSIMRGCDNYCSYCIVPYVRGGEVSRPFEEVIKEVRAVVRNGAKEVTLLGQNIDAYGKDISSSLAELLEMIEKNVTENEGLKRLRFITSHPRDITKELVRAVGELPRVAKHFNMPAQSGSDKVLELMKRGYSRKEYEEKIELIRKIVPNALVSSDFIVGFPGEEEEDFIKTVELIKYAEFQNTYIFKYSPRPGTLASKIYEDNISDEVKRKRNHILLETQNEVSLKRLNTLVGSTQKIMVEGESAKDKSRWMGRTNNNILCVFDYDSKVKVKPGDFIELKIDRATALTLYGKVS